MNSLNEPKQVPELPIEHGRVIAQAMHDFNVQKEKNMIKADKRKATMLEKAAEKALSGN